MKFQLLSLCFLLVTFSACKTQEDIRREKTVENLNEQVAQTQKSTANAGQRFNTIEEQLAKLNGQFEEGSHNRQQEIKENALVKERLNGLEETNKKQTEYMRALNEKVQEQGKYIEQVLATLTSLSEKDKEKEKEREKERERERNQEVSSKKKESKEESSSNENPQTIKNAVSKYKARDYDGAKDILLAINDSKKAKKKDKEAATYYLGMIEYKSKNYEEAKVYFSKLFSENPESSFSASVLLNLAKTFEHLKSKEESRQTLDELITRFPKSKEAQEGAKMKAKH
jgi:TolA-binding protein